MEYINKSPHDYSDVSTEISRNQTPILQQLYLSMTNWERLVGPNAFELNKIKKFRKQHKAKKSFSKDAGDYSDVSSLDLSPKLSKSLKFNKKRKTTKALLMKSLSLGTVHNNTSSSSDEDYEPIMLSKSLSIMGVSSRPVSCPPGTTTRSSSTTNTDYV